MKRGKIYPRGFGSISKSFIFLLRTRGGAFLGLGLGLGFAFLALVGRVGTPEMQARGWVLAPLAPACILTAVFYLLLVARSLSRPEWVETSNSLRIVYSRDGEEITYMSIPFSAISEVRVASGKFGIVYEHLTEGAWLLQAVVPGVFFVYEDLENSALNDVLRTRAVASFADYP